MQSDLYGQSLLNITHPDDHAFLKQQLIPTDLHNLFLAKTDENGEVRQRTQEEEDEIDRKLREDRRDFNIRWDNRFESRWPANSKYSNFQTCQSWTSLGANDLRSRADRRLLSTSWCGSARETSERPHRAATDKKSARPRWQRTASLCQRERYCE